MIRLFVDAPMAAGAETPLGPEPSRYLTSVMRQAVGAELRVFNGRDGEWRAILAQAGKRGVVLQLIDRVRTQATGPDLDLIVALIKRGPLEFVVEKATELGVRSLQLVSSDRSNAPAPRLDRLASIAAESAEQTGRLDVPEILPVRRLAEILAAWPGERRLLFCDEAGDAAAALSALAVGPDGPWAILIGPEGGFSPAERASIRALPQATPVSLGPRILRADTAAIAALTLWQAARGDWRGA